MGGTWQRPPRLACFMAGSAHDRAGTRELRAVYQVLQAQPAGWSYGRSASTMGSSTSEHDLPLIQARIGVRGQDSRSPKLVWGLIYMVDFFGIPRATRHIPQQL